MARLIERVVKKPLSESLLFGALAEGGSVRLVVRNDTIALEGKSRNQESGVRIQGWPRNWGAVLRNQSSAKRQGNQGTGPSLPS
jgi:hypothetical protein